MNEDLFKIGMYGLGLIVVVILGVILLAVLAYVMGFVFENWITWCEVDVILLRTIIVAVGLMSPLLVVRSVRE